jgi:hypothetical protein
MKAYWVSGGIAPTILDLGTSWRWVVSSPPRSLYPQGKSPWYPLYRRLGGHYGWSGHCGEEKNSQPLPGLDLPIIQPIAHRYTLRIGSASPLVFSTEDVRCTSAFCRCKHKLNGEFAYTESAPVIEIASAASVQLILLFWGTAEAANS